METDHSAEWANLTPEEKKRKLYEKQKALLDTFLEHHAFHSYSTIKASVT